MILPGVGAAGATMDHLRRLGLDQVLRDDVIRRRQAFFGICIGIQILMDRSEEDEARCLGVIAGEVRRFPPAVDGRPLKVPQIGWNRVHQLRAHPIFAGVARLQPFLLRQFVLSGSGRPGGDVIATADHGVTFCAAVARDNLVATQFHLEKSGEAGLQVLDNFCRLS